MEKSARKQWLIAKGMVVSLALATAFLFPIWRHLLFSQAEFHHVRPSMVDFEAAGILLGLVSVAFTAVFTAMRRLPWSWRRRTVFAFCMAILLLGPVNDFRLLLGDVLPTTIARSYLFIGFPWMACLLVVIVGKLSYRRLCRLLLIGTPFAVLVICKIGLAMVKVPAGESRVSAHYSGPLKGLTNRVVWIIFDELDYRIGFQERPPGVEMPNFDALVATSYRFTNATAPANQTLLSVPSLLDGVLYTNAFPAGPAHLRLRRLDGMLSQWGAEPNVFTDTKDLGGKSAVTGWYFPYTRIFGPSVEHSKWYGFSTQSFIGQGLPLFATVKLQFLNAIPYVRKLLHGFSLDGVATEAFRMLGDPSYDFCFVHLPAPHLPVITGPDRKSTVLGLFSDPRAYLHNLAVADSVLGRCLYVLQRTPAGSRTTLIVSSDHPWRISEKYDGKSDPRVPFLIRFPGQKTGSDIGKAFQTVRTRDIVREVLSSRELTGAESILTFQGGNFR